MENEVESKVEKSAGERKPAKVWDKLVLAGKVFKWMFVVLLVLLLIAGLYFRAPAKVMILLIVFFVGSAVLPRRARKWFWLAVGVAAAVIMIWVFLPDSSEGWEPYYFKDELNQLESKNSISDEENAVLIYSRLFENEQKYRDKDLKREKKEDKKFKELIEKGEQSIKLSDAKDINDVFGDISFSSYYPDFWTWELDRLTRTKPWSSGDYPEVVQWLKTRQETIDGLIQASQFEKCKFPIPFDSVSLEKHFIRLSFMRRSARLLLRAANNDIADGRLDEAILKYKTVLKMADHQFQQHTLTDFLVAYAIESQVLKQHNQLIITANPKKKQIDEFQKALDNIEHDWSSIWRKVLDCEKLLAKNTFCNLMLEINERKQIRYRRNFNVLPVADTWQEESPMSYWQQKLQKLGIVARWFFWSKNPQQYSKTIDEVYEQFYEMAEANYDWKKVPGEFDSITSFSSVRLTFKYMASLGANVVKPAYYRIHDEYIRLLSDENGCRIVIALQRYKNDKDSFPQSLNDLENRLAEKYLTDPANDGEFVYKRTDQGFRLYSKGKNNVDEDGKGYGYVDSSENNLPDDWLIWPKDDK